MGADSRQIYRFMDVGTGKVEADKRRYKRGLTQIIAGGVAHYLIDVVNPDEEFTVADYKKMAIAAIKDILGRGKLPFLVGGTGLYIQAVADNLEIPTVPPNKKLRAKFERELSQTKDKRQKIKEYYKWLLKLDPGAKDLVSPQNPRRIIRALEVCLATHQPFSKLREKGKPLFDVLQIGIDVLRSELYNHIDRRVDKMIKDGLMEETKKLIEKGYDEKLPSMSGIGYKEISEFLSKKTKDKRQKKFLLKEAAQKIKFRTHAYARRQMTWFRRDKRIKWVKSYKEAEKKVKEFLISK